MNEASKLISDSFERRCMAAGLSMTLGPGWIEITLFGSCSPVTETFCGHQKWKHKYDAQRKSCDTYKKARIKRWYHLTPAITDAGYAITPATITSEEDLEHICSQYILFLQDYKLQWIKLLNSLEKQLIKIHPSTVCGSISKDHNWLHPYLAL